MNEIKPLDQVLSIEADAHNQITKVVNKFGSRGSILYYCCPVKLKRA